MRLVVFIHWWMHLPTLLRTRTWTYRREGIFTPAVEDIISHTMMSNDEKILSLLKTYFEPDDYFLVYKRMIGTGTGKCGPHRICQHYESFRSGIPQATRTWIQR